MACGPWRLPEPVPVAFAESSRSLPPEFFTAYEQEWPLDPSYPQRRPALQLHKLLVNIRHFGHRRVPQVEAILDDYGW